jgi:hypothetical protein
MPVGRDKWSDREGALPVVFPSAAGNPLKSKDLLNSHARILLVTEVLVTHHS